jgi:hypothetical protein
MSDDIKYEPLAPVAVALKDLLEAAARFGLVASKEYGAQRPDDMAAYMRLFNTGQADLIAEVRLSPHQQVTLLFEIDGERCSFFETTRINSRASLQ